MCLMISLIFYYLCMIILFLSCCHSIIYTLQIMTEIRPEPVDIIYGKLKQIKCCTGCLNAVNYLVFGYGLYCSKCLSTLPEINKDHFIDISALAKVLVAMAEEYEQRIVGQTSQLNLIKGEMEAMRKDVSKLKDGLGHDLKTIKDKSSALIDQLYAQCLKQNQNEPLEGFFEPDISATILVNQSMLLLQNLQNLQITKSPQGKIEYNLKEGKKNPQKINKKVVKQYKQLNQCIQSSIIQAQGVISNFLKEVEAEENKKK